MRTNPDVLIIGGGVIGLTTAYFLARNGTAVTLLDRSAPGSEASWAGAGIIPPGNLRGAASPYDRLRAESSQMFPSLSSDLREQTGIDNGYRICGGIEVFEQPLPEIVRIWKKEGIENLLVDLDWLGRNEPGVRITADEVYDLPGMAQVRNPWHIRALLAACGRLGVIVESNVPVVRLGTIGGRVVDAFSEHGQEWAADQILISSGAWSDQLLGKLGYRSNVHPVRGQVVLFRPPTPLLNRIVCVGKRYLVPRVDGRILVGSTEEPKAGFDKRTTEAGVSELIRFAMQIVPHLAPNMIEKNWAGLRPGSPDGMPFLGQIPGWDNAFVAAGHHRAGIQLSAATGRIMADLIVGRQPPFSIEAFRPDRPIGPVPATAFRS
jgi:glycine oxidase